MDAATDLEIDADTRQRVDDLRREVLRDRDRLNTASLRLRFVSQPETHPFQGMLWDHRAAGNFVSGWISPGSWMCGITLPTQNGDSFARYQVFIDDLNDEACSKLKQHGNEVAALLRRLGAEATKEQETQLFRELFEVHRLTNTLIWSVNEELGRPETCSCVATIPDVFQAIANFLAELLSVSGPVDSTTFVSSLSEQGITTNQDAVDAAWIHPVGSKPPAEFFSEKWLTGTKEELGFALRHPKHKEVGERQLRNNIKRMAMSKCPKIWCRATVAGHIDVFLRHHEPLDTNAVLKELHEAEARLDERRKAKACRTEVGGSLRKPPSPKRTRK